MRNIDEINNLNRRSEDIQKYFAEMDLTSEQLEKRVECAYLAFTVYDLLLIMFLTMKEYNDIDEDYLKTTLTNRILSVITGMSTPDDYLIDYAIKSSDAFVDNTIKNQDDDFYSSEDRALISGELFANAVSNYTEYKTAQAEGKTHKVWHSVKLPTTREPHANLSGHKIRIDELFNVGGIKMRFPMDAEPSGGGNKYLKQAMNCKCTVKYLSEDEEV